MLDEAREHATILMFLHAEDLGSDTLVNIRHATSAVASGMPEKLAYGTAGQAQVTLDLDGARRYGPVRRGTSIIRLWPP